MTGVLTSVLLACHPQTTTEADYDIPLGDSITIKDYDIPTLQVEKQDTHFDIEPNGLLKYKETPFSGHLITRYPNGNIKYNLAYFEGKQCGWSYAYFSNGSTMYKRYYLEGQKHGKHLGWYADQTLKYAYYFLRGKSIGNHKTWYSDGTLYKDQNYKNGKEFGPQKIYRTDGKLRGNYFVRADGKKFGLLGLKRCEQIDTKEETMIP